MSAPGRLMDEFTRTAGGRVSVRDMLVDAQRRLEAAGIESASVDAAEIIALVMGTTRSRLVLQDAVDDDRRVRIEQLLTRRASRVPLQHLVGSAPFRRIEVAVGPGVFIPRPETELVTEAAIRELLTIPHAVAVDLCTGTGAIAISLAIEVPGSRIHAVEVDEQAIGWTHQNAAGLEARITESGSSLVVVHDDAGVVADAGHALAECRGLVDVVISNPPYIPNRMVPRDPEVRDHDPRRALFGGEDGLDVARAVAQTAAALLRPEGLLIMEHADSQGPDGIDGGMPALLAAHLVDGHPMWEQIVDRIDYNGHPRFTMARRTAWMSESPTAQTSG